MEEEGAGVGRLLLWVRRLEEKEKEEEEVEEERKFELVILSTVCCWKGWPLYYMYIRIYAYTMTHTIVKYLNRNITI